MNVRKKTIDVMLRLGLNPKYKGYEYLLEGVKMFYSHNKPKKLKMKEIYSKIAKKFEVNELTVEKNMRHMVQDAYNRGTLLAINDYCENEVYDGAYKLKNGELISMISEIIKLSEIKSHLK